MTREEAMQILTEHKNEYFHTSRIENAIDKAIEALSADTIPIEKYHELQHQFVMLGATFADLTEVVRCKDCKHYIVEGITTQYGWCHEYKHSVDEDDYCSYGDAKK